MREALAPTTPYTLVTMKAYVELPFVDNYDIEVADVHEFYASGISVQNCSGTYHPHGTAAIDETINGMVEGAHTPLLKGQGNFGSYTKTAPAAAARYTECKLLRETERYLLDPYYLAVTPMVDNYDGSHKEPVYLPAKLPYVLATGASGIAMATTTKIPAYSLESLRQAVIYWYTAKRPTSRGISKMLQLTSPYGGKTTADEDELHTLFTSNSAKIGWICDYNQPDDTTIEVTGFYPGWNYDSKLASLQLVDGVTEVRDLSEGETIRLVIVFNRNAPDAAYEKVQKQLEGFNTYRCNVTTRRKTKDEVPEARARFKNSTPFSVFQQWCIWRERIEIMALKNELKDLTRQLQREKLLLTAINHIDIIFKLLKTKGIDKIVKLAEALNISIDDSKYIWSIAVGRLDRLSGEEQQKKITKLNDDMRQVRYYIKNPVERIVKHLKADEV